MNSQIEETLRNLKANNFHAIFADDKEAVKSVILKLISKDSVVGLGDSATLRQIGIVEDLQRRGNKVLYPSSRELTAQQATTEVRDNISRQIFSSDALLTSANAVTLDGKLVNIDAVGNRVASTIFGPRKVFVIVGKNKIVKDIDEALHRIKNLIAPFHAKTKGYSTPCAKTGECYDCNAPKRICSVTAIIEKRPWRTDISVIVVNEDLGLSWDETWPQERIAKIKSNYEKVTWIFTSGNIA